MGGSPIGVKPVFVKAANFGFEPTFESGGIWDRIVGFLVPSSYSCSFQECGGAIGVRNQHEKCNWQGGLNKCIRAMLISVQDSM